MSVNYASELSVYEHKGKCGMAEKFDEEDELNTKIKELVLLMKNSSKTTVITGAGISTSAGIPDFRGPNGVWTLEERGETPNVDITFVEAIPTVTHLALVALEDAGYVHHVISQNIDGLHLRSGFPRNCLSELHGNMFVEECNNCYTQYVRGLPVPTMTLKPTGNSCEQIKKHGRCRGKLYDTILDWEDSLPEADLEEALHSCRTSDLCICLGTSLQIVPCGNMPLATKRNGGKIVIVNLQSTKQDKKCDMKLHAYVDTIMTEVCNSLQIEVPTWRKPSVNLVSQNKKKCLGKYPKIVVDASVDSSLQFT